MAGKAGSYNCTPIPYGASVEALRLIAMTPGRQAWAACIALGHKEDPLAIEILEEFAASKDWRYRRIAIEAMTTHRLAATRARIFCGGLTDVSPYVARTACHAVSALRLNRARNPVRNLVRSGDPSTRVAALAALRILWQPPDFDLAFPAFLKDTSKEVRNEAAWTLRANADKDNWKRLFEVWKKDPVHRHRIWACELAGGFGDGSLLHELQAMLTDSNGHVRKAAAKALEALSR